MKIFTFLVAVFLTANMFSQSPEKMSYQAVIRNASNNLVSSKTVGMKISILQGSATGTVVYAETQTTTTNANGLVSVEIGDGTVVSGTFANINWANGPYFIKTETDPTGGTNYTINGTSQLLSVPYALYAKTTDGLTGKVDKVTGKDLSTNDYTTAEQTKLAGIAPGAEVNVQADWNATSGDAQILNKPTIPAAQVQTDWTASSGMGVLLNKPANIDENKNDDVTLTGNQTIAGNKNFTGTITVPAPVNTNDAANKAYVDSKAPIHYIGESYGGGIVFYVYDNGQHGLIAATTNQGTEIQLQWYNGTNRYTSTTGDGLYAGAMNTTMITATQMADNPTGNFAAKACADYSVTVGGVTYGDWYLPSKYELNLLYEQKSMVSGLISDYYWSSTEATYYSAWIQTFFDGSQINVTKNNTYYVRAVRAF